MKVRPEKMTSAVCQRCRNQYTVEDAQRTVEAYLQMHQARYKPDLNKFCGVCSLMMVDGYANPADWQ